MGFFSKLKQNFTHGGVKVKLQAPASVSTQDAAVPVTVTVSASDGVQVIKGITVEIVAESRNQAFNNAGTSTAPAEQKTVARTENTESFTLAGGESRDIQIPIVMNAGAQLESQLPEGSGMATVAHALQGLQNLSQAFDHTSYRYFVRATADVDGIALDPSDQQDIQVLGMGQTGGAVGLHL